MQETLRDSPKCGLVRWCSTGLWRTLGRKPQPAEGYFNRQAMKDKCGATNSLIYCNDEYLAKRLPYSNSSITNDTVDPSSYF